MMEVTIIKCEKCGRELHREKVGTYAGRITADGYVHCAICGKPILKMYDLIIHHKKKLSDENVNDAMISLNPDNMECVCFSCHNVLHDRWNGKVEVKIIYANESLCPYCTLRKEDNTDGR